MVRDCDFCHIHNHTHYSKFDGYSTVKKLVKAAKNAGHRAVGLTDHGTVAGSIEFLKTCRREKIKPIIGMEAYLSRDYTCHSKEGQPGGRRGNRHTNVIAKNFVGFQNLCELSQIASLEGYYYDPRIDLELLNKYKEGLIITSACLSNIINNALVNDEYEKAKQSVAIFKDIFGDDFYLEMMYHGLSPEQKILPDIQKLGKEMDVKVIITNDCLLPGSMILTDEGYRAIETLRVGDLVYTHKGRLRPIDFVNSQLYDGKVYKLKTRLGSFHVSATSNHPILINRTVSAGWEIEGKPFWKEAKEVVKGDLLCIPKYCIDFVHRKKNYESTIDIMEILGERWYIKEHEGKIKSTRRDKDVSVPRQLKLDRHFCQILGLYLAEGYIDGTVVGFGLYKREQVLVDIICSFFEKYDFHPTVKVDENGCSVRVNSFVFSAVLEHLVGKGSAYKTMPSHLQFSEEEMRTIIRYYFEGDGHMKLDGFTYMIASCSSKLIWRLSEMLKNWGVLSLPTVRNGETASGFHRGAKSIWNDLYVLNFSGENVRKLNSLFGIEYSGSTPKGTPCTRPRFTEDDDFFYVRVQEVVESHRTDLVWNLQVALDESYVCYGYAVHNCHYIEKSDAPFQEVLMCMSSNRSIKDPNRIKFPYPEFYFKSTKEMQTVFGHLPQSMMNTLEIAEKCDYSDLVFIEEGGDMRLPHFDLPSGFDSSFRYMEKLAWDGFKSMPFKDSEIHRKRLERELADIKLVWDTKRYDFSTYFLIHEDIMRFAREKGIAAGIRGSGYGSLLVRCLNISEGVDPIEQNLMWERMLGFDSSVFISEEDFGINSPNCEAR